MYSTAGHRQNIKQSTIHNKQHTINQQKHKKKTAATLKLPNLENQSEKDKLNMNFKKSAAS
jgi:hypothetical protein